ncbi:hypothetical protein B0H13DRAFT_1928709 [Mycena leptocephala]|nr:hypothetical protein B0H13DRAFT_1928709 [Mycena leptocephala]
MSVAPAVTLIFAKGFLSRSDSGYYMGSYSRCVLYRDSSYANDLPEKELYLQLEGLLADGTIKPMKIEVVKGGLNALEAFKTFDKVSGVKRVMLPQETRAL